MQQLDIRLPMGLLFLILGVILCAQGIFADPSDYMRHSLGHNVNLTWGGVFAGFGALMLLLSRLGRKK